MCLKIKEKEVIIGLFSFGFVVGCVLMSGLCLRASRVYLATVESNYIVEQESLGDYFALNRNRAKALRHYSNVVEAVSGAPLSSFNPDHVKWTIGYPFTSMFLPHVQGRSKAIGTGICHGKLAAVLESMGEREAASREYSIACHLMGLSDVRQVRQVILRLMPLATAKDDSVPIRTR
jgi:hypothetical protein